MPDKKAKEPTKPVPPAAFRPPGKPERKPTVFEQLRSLRKDIEAEMEPGHHPDIVRIALGNVLGAIDHVRDARHQADPLWRRH
jgi:hypothetical protein